MNTKSDVSVFRLDLLRAMYVFMVVGLAVQKLPGILNPSTDITHLGTVVGSVLGEVMLLAGLYTRQVEKAGSRSRCPYLSWEQLSCPTW